MAKSNEREADVKHINARGEFVEATDASAAFSVNMGDPDALNFIEGVKKGAPVAVDDSKGALKSEAKKKPVKSASAVRVDVMP